LPRHRKVKPHQIANYMLATAMMWETCYEVVAMRWLDVVASYRLHRRGR
jgi:hypothetical protein